MGEMDGTTGTCRSQASGTRGCAGGSSGDRIMSECLDVPSQYLHVTFLCLSSGLGAEQSREQAGLHLEGSLTLQQWLVPAPLPVMGSVGHCPCCRHELQECHWVFCKPRGPFQGQAVGCVGVRAALPFFHGVPW